MPDHLVGHGGCCAMTKRKGTLRHCAQPAIVHRDGLPYCYYHDPENPRKFGDGYLAHERLKAREQSCKKPT